jgi:dihydroxyacetone kinase
MTYLHQLMLPKSDGNTFAHFGGLGALTNMYSPEVFSSGDFHAIFVGYRPVLVSKITGLTLKQYSNRVGSCSKL